MQISPATQLILAKLDSNQAVLLAKIEALSQVYAQADADQARHRQLLRWVFGTCVAVVAALLVVGSAFGVI